MMRHYVLIVSLLIGPAAWADTFIEFGGRVVVEAEHYESKTADVTGTRAWYVQQGASSGPGPDPDPFHTGASGNAYVECKPDTRVTHSDPFEPGSFYNSTLEGARLNYRIYFQTPGTYWVWVRTQSTGTEDNGIHVGVNGSIPATGWRIQWCGGGWRWSNAQRDSGGSACGVNGTIRVTIPSAGEHVISFWQREDGCEMDRFLLTNSSNYEPSGIGPAESETLINQPVIETNTSTIEWTVRHTTNRPRDASGTGRTDLRIVNASFETPALFKEPVGAGQVSQTQADQLDPIPGWTLDFKPAPPTGHAMGILDLRGQLPGEQSEHGAADGNNAAYINGNGGGGTADSISQVLAAPAIAGDLYALNVALSGRLDYATPDYRVELLINGVPVASDHNTLAPLPASPRTWVTSTLNHTPTAGQEGQPISVRLAIPTPAGVQMLFDHVRVSKTFNPRDQLFLAVRNKGAGTLNYQITENIDWLSLSGTNGSSTGEFDTFDLTLDVDELPIGTYNSEIVVSDVGALNSPLLIPVTLHVVPIPGDFDGDGDVDQTDFGHLQRCFSGAGVHQNEAACADARLDVDMDVDQNDFGIFQACFSGANRPADAGCVD